MISVAGTDALLWPTPFAFENRGFRGDQRKFGEASGAVGMRAMAQAGFGSQQQTAVRDHGWSRTAVMMR
jgi:hypothetical protein